MHFHITFYVHDYFILSTLCYFSSIYYFIFYYTPWYIKYVYTLCYIKLIYLCAISNISESFLTKGPFLGIDEWHKSSYEYKAHSAN